jgi:hypothetical protein
MSTEHATITVARERKITSPLGMIESDIEVELEVECTFECHPFHAGHRDKYGAPEEPDDPAELEFDGATVDGVDFELTESEIDQAREKLENELSERDEPP